MGTSAYVKHLVLYLVTLTRNPLRQRWDDIVEDAGTTMIFMGKWVGICIYDKLFPLGIIDRRDSREYPQHQKAAEKPCFISMFQPSFEA